MKIEHLRSRRREEAMERGINPRDVDLLLSDVTGQPLSWLISHGSESADEHALDALLERRYAGEPIQYIRGKTEFYSREFYVDDRVLIPRPETELLVEAAIERVPRGARVIDVGTGSGCIAVTLGLERPDLRVIGVDRALGALAVARRNGLRNAIAGDILDAVREFDFVVSNPPYIPERDIATLAREVRDFEPRGALTPGPRGTEAIERILEGARGKPVMLEIGYGQDAIIRDVARAHRYEVDAILDDLAAIPRVVVLSAA
jgi:release factor glutamine methyltransferase